MPPGREAARRRAPSAVTLADPATGRGIVRASLAGTTVLAVTAVVADIAPRTLDLPALAVALVMFFAGTAIVVWAIVVAIARSRSHDVTLGGVFGLEGTTPPAVRLRLLGSLAAEAVVGVATAAVRPYTTLSFGILAFMWGLGLVGLWGARYGAFPTRRPDGRWRGSAGGGGGGASRGGRPGSPDGRSGSRGRRR